MNFGSAQALPPGWAWARLSDLAEIAGGITKGQRRKPEQVLRTVPYLRVANVQRGFLDLGEIKLIDSTEHEIEQLKLRQGDVLFTEGGNRDKLGQGWVWRGELPECIHQNHIFRARLYSAELQPKLISWYGNSLAQEYFTSQGKQTTNLASINMTKLSALPVPVPPAAEQVRIVAKLEQQFTCLDDAVASLKRAQANLKRYRASVLKVACEGRLVPTEAELTRANRGSYESGEQLLVRILAERQKEWANDQQMKRRMAGNVSKGDAGNPGYPEPAFPTTAGVPRPPEGWSIATLEVLTSATRPICYGILMPKENVTEGVLYVHVPRMASSTSPAHSEAREYLAAISGAVRWRDATSMRSPFMSLTLTRSRRALQASIGMSCAR